LRLVEANALLDGRWGNLEMDDSGFWPAAAIGRTRAPRASRAAARADRRRMGSSGSEKGAGQAVKRLALERGRGRE